MEIIQAIVQKFVNKMSVGFLLLLLTLVFFVWTAGLGFPATLFIYNNISIAKGIKPSERGELEITDVKGVDFLNLGVALELIIFFSYFRELRNESLFGDLLFPLITIESLVIKWIEWTKWDRGIYLIVFSVFLGITFIVYLQRSKYQKDKASGLQAIRFLIFGSIRIQSEVL
ncbi:hypothetical protein EfmAA242_09740 [Enterococcus faecium]|nr:hypothetical protein EfmAA242_09740 [Enterococcus faecium]